MLASHSTLMSLPAFFSFISFYFCLKLYKKNYIALRTYPNTKTYSNKSSFYPFSPTLYLPFPYRKIFKFLWFSLLLKNKIQSVYVYMPVSPPFLQKQYNRIHIFGALFYFFNSIFNYSLQSILFRTSVRCTAKWLENHVLHRVPPPCSFKCPPPRGPVHIQYLSEYY